MLPPLQHKALAQNKNLAIWQLAFRPFFLGGCFYSVIAVALWWASLHGYLSLNIYGNWLWWHSHEMIFGFTCAIIVGFLLTAVQTWTGIAGIHGFALAGLFALWAGARLAMFLAIPNITVIILDTAFLPIAAFVLARPIIKIKMFRNLVFICILMALMILNLTSHLAVANQLDPRPYFHGAIMLIVLMITVMGGRVIPIFTANALKVKITAPPQGIEYCLILSTVLIIIFALLGFQTMPAWLLSSVCLISIAAHCVRLYYWFHRNILNKPIVWSLHLAYSFIPLGFLLLLLQGQGWAITTSLALHSFTFGGIGGIILAMISRVALGHTGRPLALPKAMPAALFMMFLGSVIRILLPWLSLHFYSTAISASALCWGVAFSIFLLCYSPFLFNQRVDGKPG